MVLAELEIFHTRRIAPVRRLALGDCTLPGDDPTDPGAVLLAGVIGSLAHVIAPEHLDDIDDVLVDIGAGRPVAQPRLRYRFQTDSVGLERSVHRLHDKGDELYLELDDRSFEHPMPQVLGAAYAVMKLPLLVRHDAVHLARHALRRTDDTPERLLAWLASDMVWRQDGTEIRWALRVLGFDGLELPSREAIVRRFRKLVRTVHPDLGGVDAFAGERISRLQEAKYVLVAQHEQPQVSESV